MGLARLLKVTVISPRSDYEEVAKGLAQFEEFHPIGGEPDFDPKLQELAVRAVRLFAQADQAAKDLALQLMPGTIDIVFRGVKIPRSDFEAESWEGLLDKADADLGPVLDEIRTQKAMLQKVAKEEVDAQTLRDALQAVAGFSADLGDLPKLQRLKAVLTVVQNEKLAEIRNSFPDTIFLAQRLNSATSLVLVASQKSDEARIEKTMKVLDLKALSLPGDLPQNPSEAYQKLSQDLVIARKERAELEANLEQIKAKDQTLILAIRELGEVARDALDEARMSGPMKRFAAISGYIPARREREFGDRFGKWMVQMEEIDPEKEEGFPTLLENPGGMKPFQLITGQQGTPGVNEVDTTPLISLVFPIFFGLMFGDFGHAIIITAVALLVRQRGTGSMRQWGNIFLACGISSMVFGAVFGEFFGFSLYKVVPIPPLLEIVQRPIGGNASIITGNIEVVMLFAILIGIAHLTTGLSLDVFQAAKARERLELVVAKIPTLTMYLSGVGYGIAFIGAGYSFDVFKKVATPAPLFTYVGLNIPNNLLGALSLAVLLASMFVLFAGRGVAAMTGKLKGRSVGELFAEGGLEVFERISQFLSNTISYIRLAIMLLVHAVLLLTISPLLSLTDPVLIVPWIILNALILSFEAFVVYVQDLRLHIYEFFTKFYRGTGTPFRKIMPDRVRTKIEWT